MSTEEEHIVCFAESSTGALDIIEVHNNQVVNAITVGSFTTESIDSLIGKLNALKNRIQFCDTPTQIH